MIVQFILTAPSVLRKDRVTVYFELQSVCRISYLTFVDVGQILGKEYLYMIVSFVILFSSSSETGKI